MGDIVIQGARVHNLRDVDLAIPRDRLVVFTGPSGSGKSSLAFDTLFAEGQRRYVESLSPAAQSALGTLPRPDVDAIDGLSPAIAVGQSWGVRGTATVGEVTEVTRVLALLYARCGRVRCHACGADIAALTVQEMVDRILALPEGTKLMLLAPIGERGEALAARVDELVRAGYQRGVVDGERVDLAEGPPELAQGAELAVAVDRLVRKSGIEARLADSLELALGLADGAVVVDVVGGDRLRMSSRFACGACGIAYPPIEPRLLSRADPAGACPVCRGLSRVAAVDPDRLVPEPDRPLTGAIAPWRGAGARYHAAVVGDLCRQLGVEASTPWREAPERVRRALLWGADAARAEVELDFAGAVADLERRLARARESDPDDLERLEPYLRWSECVTCEATGLGPVARSVTVGALDLGALLRRGVDDARAALASVEVARNQAVAPPLLAQIEARLSFASRVGLGYLALDRAMATVSGGERQRLRLATQLGAPLAGVLYILDEPTAGLHVADRARLLEAVRGLVEAGNSVIAVEHDREAILGADHVVDLGPGAGEQGGCVVASGSPAAIAAHPTSRTGAHLAGRARVERTAPLRPAASEHIEIRGARAHNLRGVDVSLPAARLSAITGVSGAGKSSLAIATLAASAAAGRPVDCDAVSGAALAGRLVVVDQSPIGRSPRSTPATFIGLAPVLRELFAGTPEARARGYGPGRFSFNVAGGRCEACQGDGVVRIDLGFLPDAFVPCEVCGGARYGRETLEVRYRGLSIAEVFELTADEASELFGRVPRAHARLGTMRSVGLGYLRLGQAATTLSGGEAQRLKLARELAKRDAGGSLIVLDEPTLGLHFDDVAVLVGALDALVEQGDTVVCVEHDLDFLRCCDWLVELGPGAGPDGGLVLATGTPTELAATDTPTGRALRARS